jgi:hypothetical protein
MTLGRNILAANEVETVAQLVGLTSHHAVSRGPVGDAARTLLFAPHSQLRAAVTPAQRGMATQGRAQVRQPTSPPPHGTWP